MLFMSSDWNDYSYQLIHTILNNYAALCITGMGTVRRDKNLRHVEVSISLWFYFFVPLSLYENVYLSN